MPERSARPSLADQSAAPGGAAAVDRALTRLKLFGASRAPLQLSELAERAQLYKSTTLRLLASLEHARLVQRQGDGRYALGPAIPRLHASYSASFSPARRLRCSRATACPAWPASLRRCSMPPACSQAP